MKANRIKNITFLSGEPEDVYAETADIFVTLEDDDDEYLFEVTTPPVLVSGVNRKRFLEPNYPFLIVRELTPAVIKEAIEEFLAQDGYWFKFYYAVPLMDMEDVDLIIDRHKKKMEAEEEED